MRLNADGTVSMRLNCNRAAGTWSAQPGSDRNSGQFSFGPLAVTQAFCPPPSMDASIAKQSTYIRGYLLKDGRLYLSLMADGGGPRGHAAAEFLRPAISPDGSASMGPDGRTRAIYFRMGRPIGADTSATRFRTRSCSAVDAKNLDVSGTDR